MRRTLPSPCGERGPEFKELAAWFPEVAANIERIEAKVRDAGYPWNWDERKPEMKHVVMFSGGAGSWATAKRVAEKHGTENLVLLFADTLMEDDDLYRFLDEAAEDVGGELVKVAEGRDPWQVFFDVRFLGNSRVDPCSRILKRELLRKWLEEHCTPSETTVYIGIDWSESHRFERAEQHWDPWKCYAPMCDPPYLDKLQVLEALREAGIRPPRLYELGFPHNNCGGFCIKAGQAHFKLLLETMPERYAYHERREAELREHLGKKVSVLRDRRGGETTPMTLTEFRQRVQATPEQLDLFEWGGCACFTPTEEEGPDER